MRRMVAGVLIPALLSSCGFAVIPLPNTEGSAVLLNQDLAYTQWDEGVFQITTGASSPYDNVTRRIEDTEYGSNYVETRSVDENAATLTFWSGLLGGVVGFIGGVLTAGGGAAP